MNDHFTIGVSTVSFVGYDLNTALDHIADTGYQYVEIAAVEGGLEHLTQRDLSAATARRVKQGLDARGLKTNALSAHSSLTNADAAEHFTTRLQFAAELGASICVTNAGSRDRIAALESNLDILLKEAEKLGIVIALETNADIVTVAQDAVDIVARFNSPWLGLNYDPANVYRATSGEVEPVADFQPVVDTVKHVHIKDMHEIATGWEFCAPGLGIIDVAGFLRTLRARTTPVGVNLELPYRLRLPRLNGAIEIRDELPDLADVDKQLVQVRELIESMLLIGV